jgi:hypothetical protein
MKARRICLFALFLTSFLQVLQGEEDFKLVFLENRATKVEMEIMLAGAQYIYSFYQGMDFEIDSSQVNTSPDFSRMAVARKSRSFPQRDLAEEEAQSIRVIGECSIPQRK